MSVSFERVPGFPLGLAQTKGHSMAPLYCSILEAGQALGVKRSTVYRLINDGRLKTAKLGTRTLVQVASVHALATSIVAAA